MAEHDRWRHQPPWPQCYSERRHWTATSALVKWPSNLYNEATQHHHSSEDYSTLYNRNSITEGKHSTWFLKHLKTSELTSACIKFSNTNICITFITGLILSSSLFKNTTSQKDQNFSASKENHGTGLRLCDISAIIPTWYFRAAIFSHYLTMKIKDLFCFVF